MKAGEAVAKETVARLVQMKTQQFRHLTTRIIKRVLTSAVMVLGS